MRGPARPAGLLLSGVTVVALAGCGAGTAERAAAAPHAASPAAATSSVDPSSLSAGLLPAGAFGAGATVMPVPADRLAQAAGLAGSLGGAQIAPQACADAVQRVAGQVDAVRGAAAELAHAGGTWTAELLLATGPQVDAAGLLGSVVTACSSATVTVPRQGTATVAIAPAPPSGLPAGASAVAVTVTAQRAGGSFTGTGLLGLVQDGDRLLLLGQAAPGGAAPDGAAFAALLARAADAEAHAR